MHLTLASNRPSPFMGWVNFPPGAKQNEDCALEPVALMSPGRDWLNREETRALINDESKEWRKEVRDYQNEAKLQVKEAAIDQAEINGRLLDGAQASLFSAALLTGDESHGLTGFIPQVNDRLTAIEAAGRATDIMVDAHHLENSTRLQNLESGQHKIRRMLIWLRAVAPELNTGWKSVIGLTTLMGINASWPAVKRIALGLFHALGK